MDGPEAAARVLKGIGASFLAEEVDKLAEEVNKLVSINVAICEPYYKRMLAGNTR